MPAPLVVQKFGGSSLADADRIRRVARRIARERAAGSQLVIVVSAMGDTTDELLELARRHHRRAGLARARRPAGHRRAPERDAPLDGPPRDRHAGHLADRRPGGDRDRRPPRPGAHRGDRTAAASTPSSTPGKVVIVAGFQGVSQAARAEGETTDPRAGRVGHDRGRPRGAPRRRSLPDLHRRARDLHGRPADRARRAAVADHRVRGDARARPPGRPGHADPGRRAGLGQRRRHRGPELLRGRSGYPHRGGSARGAAQQGPRSRP